MQRCRIISLISDFTPLPTQSELNQMELPDSQSQQAGTCGRPQESLSSVFEDLTGKPMPSAEWFALLFGKSAGEGQRKTKGQQLI